MTQKTSVHMRAEVFLFWEFLAFGGGMVYNDSKTLC